jgi:hypothetical protein
MGSMQKKATKVSSEPRRRRSARSRLRDQPLPSSAFPTVDEMGELGRFADRVALGKVKLKYVKL